MDIISIIYSILTLGLLGFTFGMLLGYASKKFEVKVDERIIKIKDCLPGANCGGCGYPGCEAYATSVVEEGANVTLCSVGGSKVSQIIGDIMGVKVEVKKKRAAFIMCNGNCFNRKVPLDTSSVSNCTDGKNLIKSNSIGCTFGCIGLGSCINVCKFNAIKIIDGIAKIDKEKCVNCGACIKVCPMGLIESIEDESQVRVACNSKDSGKIVRTNCISGCIGCKICEKNCPSDAIHVIENLAKIDYNKCTNCGVCSDKCPTKAITIEIPLQV